uniref:Uncharacterized protein n=1 Tax=Panagrellus redivivus TaxID=6233 RepID=A0A7E4UV10_PANRE
MNKETKKGPKGLSACKMAECTPSAASSILAAENTNSRRHAPLTGNTKSRVRERRTPDRLPPERGPLGSEQRRPNKRSARVHSPVTRSRILHLLRHHQAVVFFCVLHTQRERGRSGNTDAHRTLSPSPTGPMTSVIGGDIHLFRLDGSGFKPSGIDLGSRRLAETIVKKVSTYLAQVCYLSQT